MNEEDAQVQDDLDLIRDALLMGSSVEVVLIGVPLAYRVVGDVQERRHLLEQRSGSEAPWYGLGRPRVEEPFEVAIAWYFRQHVPMQDGDRLRMAAIVAINQRRMHGHA